ncbi:hypothetical protein THAOC_10825, partial [Thalassiosira oceanica]
MSGIPYILGSQTDLNGDALTQNGRDGAPASTTARPLLHVDTSTGAARLSDNELLAKYNGQLPEGATMDEVMEFLALKHEGDRNADYYPTVDKSGVSLVAVPEDTSKLAYHSCGAGHNQISLRPAADRGSRIPLNPADYPGGVFRVQSRHNRGDYRAALKDEKYSIALGDLRHNQAVWEMIRDGTRLPANDWAAL